MARVVPEDDGEDDTSEISHSADSTGDNAISERMHMRHKRKVCPVTRFQEKRQSGCKPEHSSLVLRIRKAHRKLESSHNNAQEYEEDLLRPHCFGIPVHKIRDKSASRTADNVQQSEHGGPLSCLGLAHVGEVLSVVIAKDGVNREFGAKGAGIGNCDGEGGKAEHDAEGFFVGGGRRRCGCVEDANLSCCLSFGVDVVVGGFCAFLFDVGDSNDLADRGCTGCAAGGVIGGDIDDVRVGGLGTVFFHPDVAFGPFAHGRVVTSKEHSHSQGHDDDEWNHIGDAPCLVWRETLGMDEGVIHSRHDKICDTTTRVSPTTSQGIGCSNNLLIKEPGAPDLAGDKCASKNANEEAQCDQTLRIGDEAGHGSWDGATEEKTDEDETGAEAVA